MSILIDADTTFIIQGITGREAVNMTRECLNYGSKIVGGVTPGRGGRDVYGVPVCDTVREITSRTRVVGSVLTVAPAFVPDAAFDAIAHGRAKMGGLGGPAEDARKAYTPGAVGVMSRSGGMTTEISNALTAAGLGQSTAVSIGGDAIIGSTYAELMPLFEADPETKAIVIYSEPGGPMEAQLAEHVKSTKSRLPVVAFMAGRFMDAMPGMRFGHAGTIVAEAH